MKIITANGKKTIKMSKAEWKAIGKQAGWVFASDTANEDVIIDKKEEQRKKEQETIVTVKKELSNYLISNGVGQSEIDTIINKIPWRETQYGTTSRYITEIVNTKISIHADGYVRKLTLTVRQFAPDFQLTMRQIIVYDYNPKRKDPYIINRINN